MLDILISAKDYWMCYTVLESTEFCSGGDYDVKISPGGVLLYTSFQNFHHGSMTSNLFETSVIKNLIIIYLLSFPVRSDSNPAQIG